MPDTDWIISVRNLRKEFTQRDGTRVTVLGDVSFDISRGETLVVMGGSGCGKSTLLHCLIGEYDVDDGEILYRVDDAGPPIDMATADERQRNVLRRGMGILFQSGALYNSMTVADNIALPLREHTNLDPAIINIIVTLKLQQVHMLPHRDKMPSMLSGGQKKRVGLARAAALDAKVLYYDEPSAGLDPVTSAAIDRLMKDLSDKLQITSVVVTHEMDSAFRIADRMVMLDQGRVLKIGPREEFERLRDTPLADLADPQEQLIAQFLTGGETGPLTDAEGLTQFEKLLIHGEA